MSSPCIMAGYCRNSPEQTGEQYAKCAICRLSPENYGRNMPQFWKPTQSAVRTGCKKHPGLEDEKRASKLAIRISKLKAKRDRDKTKIKTSRLAKAAEKITEKNIIKATKNSGRLNKDGDHVHEGTITLDTKLQTTRENPIIYLAELEKVRSDASRSGKLLGGLVIRNKHNVGIVVLKETDYALLVERTLNEQ